MVHTGTAKCIRSVQASSFEVHAGELGLKAILGGTAVDNLLNRRRPLKSTGGSNPPLSAKTCLISEISISARFCYSRKLKYS
jgi:hypothetical protein